MIPQEHHILRPNIEVPQQLISINAADGKNAYGRGRGSYASKVCTFCGKLGHTIENSAVIHVESDDSVQPENGSTDQLAQAEVPVITKEMYISLVALLQKNSAEAVV